MSLARHRTLPPTLIGFGSFLLLRRRHTVRTDTSSRSARVAAEIRTLG